MLGILKTIDYECANQLTHRVIRIGITEIKFAHREGERVFDWNRQTKASVVVLPCHKFGVLPS